MLARLAQFALIVLALTIGNPVNGAPLIYGTYYDETVSTGCAGQLTCRANFSQLPSDKLLMIRKISCSVLTDQPLRQAILQVSTTFNGFPLTTRYLPMGLPFSQFASSVYSTNWETDAHYLVGNGRFPLIIVVLPTSGQASLQCTIIGDLVTPIQ